MAQHKVHARREGAAPVTEDYAPAFLFDLDGTLIDSVYQHVLAWHEALEEVGTAGLGERNAQRSSSILI